MKKKLKINIVLPFVTKTGGIAVVLEYYNQMTRLGHNVRIYYPMFPYKNCYNSCLPPIKRFYNQLKHFIKNLYRFQRVISWYFEPVSVIPVPVVNNLFIKNADILMATSWPTAYDVNRLSITKGIKFYFIQGYELWDSWKNFAENTYLLPLKKITISPWLSDIIKTKYNQKIEAEIINGIRLDKFYPPEFRSSDPISILTMYDQLECKGVDETLIALRNLKSNYPEIHVILFGMYDSPQLDFEFEYHKDPAHKLLLSLYQRAHIFIFPSRGEGWGMTPVEAMACKCAIVGTPVGSVKYLNNGKNIYPVEVKNPESLYKGIEYFLNNKAEIGNFSQEGYMSVQKLKWEESAAKLESLFLKN